MSAALAQLVEHWSRMQAFRVRFPVCPTWKWSCLTSSLNCKWVPGRTRWQCERVKSFTNRQHWLYAPRGVEYGYWVNRSKTSDNSNIVKRLRVVSTSKSAISNIHYYYFYYIYIYKDQGKMHCFDTFLSNYNN